MGAILTHHTTHKKCELVGSPGGGNILTRGVSATVKGVPRDPRDGMSGERGTPGPLHKCRYVARSR